jgi:hypothetical protein
LTQPKVGVEDGVRDCAGVGAMVAAGDSDADALALAGSAADADAVAVAVELAVDVDDEVEDAVLDGCGAHAASAQASSSVRRA